ncbi:TfoX/Sxy family protein [Pseudobacter ginsenosidimutans]|uniref:TfoX-like protein n=1 Tax=Pseudobacter ginsenosidimutans TaxID=661488 RepID=A0A4Q7N462_9BACT|nr:TfoX/Sxy family protein [Pseudobacter ginsenosidimutans]QEC44319.1 TfoX/Sxy family protein [Pseudobacter ginsenosidimutans]RZS75779.1 TfoX-like protein [Pseudobacter ginsenosidimutans]
MAFNTKLADRLREYLASVPGIRIEEKRMFSGMAFMVNGKMCINVSGDNLMCRFDPALQEVVVGRNGYEPMIMKGRELIGYCYVSLEGFKTKRDFEYWVNLCLDFNSKAKASKKPGKKK